MNDNETIAKLRTLPPEHISRFLLRKRRTDAYDFNIRFDELFRDILRTANAFVPSEAGSILLDDPNEKSKGSPSKNLVFIACFGASSEKILGRTLDASEGIAGKTYHSGMPYKSQTVLAPDEYSHFLDVELNFQTRSIISVPIIIEKSVCGVLELVNRRGGSHYTDREMELLRIFAGYISTSIQNALESNRSKELSKLDDLTGLYNDRYFHYAMEQALLKVGGDFHDVGLIFFDLDNFKKINDSHGHLAGSRALNEVGGILKRLVRKKNSTLARYGGDEFVVILPGLDLNESVAIAESIRQQIASHTFLKSKSPQGDPALNIRGVITASIGVASFREHCRNPGGIHELHNQFISLADKAMYKAKETGKNCVCIANQK